MYTVRVYLNRDRGVLWWAEGDLGFTGGADTLADLVSSIREWAACEGLGDRLRIRLVGDQAVEEPLPVKVTGSAEVATKGVPAVRTSFALAGT